MSNRKVAAFGLMYVGVLFGVVGLAIWLPTTGVHFYAFITGIGAFFGVCGLLLMPWRADK